MIGAIKVNQFPRSHFKQQPVVTPNQPVILKADRIDYDHENAIVVATGHVEVIQGDTIMLADRLTYDQNSDEITASGHISMLEPSGNVYFAEEVELENELKTGVVEEFKARLVDNSVLAGNYAEKIDENKTEVTKAVYSPCNVPACTDNGLHSPIWQLEAEHATIDQAAQKITYHDAYFDAYGVPVLYTPYMSSPTPGADNQSGLLTPEYLHSTNIGSVVKTPVYYAISPDRDLTLTPMFTSEVGPVLMADYRQQFDAGPLDLNGSITNAPNIDASGNPIAGHEIRGDINGTGRFKINDTYDWGFDLYRATDDTYLGRYGFDSTTLLTTTAFVEGANFAGTNDRSYGVIRGLSFQGLTDTQNPKTIPAVLPLMDAAFQSDPGWNDSRFSFNGDAMELIRQDGTESRRLSGTTGWELPYISDDGQIIQFNSQLRSDIYDVSDVALPDGSAFNGTTGRLVPQTSALWHYPFINRDTTSSVMLEPVVMGILSPGGGNPDKIPNEDSQLPEFTDANLFSTDRFPGLDRIESGPRVSYGMRGQTQFLSDKYVDWLFGQQYRQDNDPLFPIAKNPDSHFSDYVGKVDTTFQPITLAYRFRLDKDTLEPTRTEIDSSFNGYPINMTVSYLSLKNDPILADKEAIVTSANINLASEWLWNVSVNRDLLLKQWIGTGTGLTFKNECTALTAMINRSYTEQADIKPSTNFLFQLSLKNLE